jgi:hypothetical protein
VNKMGCDHENTITIYEPKREPNGNYKPIAECLKVQCITCRSTRELSQKEKDRITPPWDK